MNHIYHGQGFSQKKWGCESPVWKSSLPCGSGSALPNHRLQKKEGLSLRLPLVLYKSCGCCQARRFATYALLPTDSCEPLTPQVLILGLK
jgi:hypothetical protein